MGAENGKKDIMENPRTYSKLLLSLALTLVVLMSGAILPQRLSRVEASGHAHPQTIHSSAAGDIITPRATTSATLLPNGKVLIACGYGTFGPQLSGPLNSSELYDPVTRTWSSTGNLSTTHGGEEFTTTLLQNGKVLIVGGSPGFGALNSAELYDSATGTWSLTGNLILGRAYHAATLLPNGEVLVVGGENGGILSSAELYNPATGTWRSTGALNFARSYHTATLLPNGKVLVVEGYGAGTTAELYDPATGRWSPTGNLTKSYYWHTTTLLPNGKVLVVGSLYFGTNKTTELYDPATGTWTVTGSLNFGRLYHTATLLSNGKVLVLGGSDRPSSTVYDSAELYDPSTGTWTLAGNLNTSRVGHTATMLRNGQVLVAGGWNGSGLLRSTGLYDPGADSISNPIDDAQFFVTQHYRDFLSREPDASGLAFWTGQITSCGSDTQCIEEKRVNVSAAYFISIEFQNTGYLVYRFYKASFGRVLRLAEFLPDTRAISQGVVVGQGNWQEQLEANKRSFADQFITRADFRAQYDNRSNAEYVDALFANAGVAPSAAERDALVAGLNGGTETRATVLRKVAENEALYQKEYNAAFVLMQYFGYLRRNPDDPPDNNLDGFNFWLTKLNSFSVPGENVRDDSVALGRVRRADMVKAFIVSGEYRRRFGPQ